MLKIILISVISLFVLQQLISSTLTSRTETPEYKVLDKIGDVEIREYPAMVMATTDMYNEGYSGSSGNGFRTVAGYIFGGNEENMKISMTSPVMMEMSDTMKMSFIMPSKYALEDLPEPNDRNVYLHEQEGIVVAVIRYGGFNNDERFAKYREELNRILDENGIDTKGKYMFWGYNPPYEMVNRRNEVVVQIKLNDTVTSGLHGK